MIDGMIDLRRGMVLRLVDFRETEGCGTANYVNHLLRSDLICIEASDLGWPHCTHVP